jgi:hypothetical protein
MRRGLSVWRHILSEHYEYPATPGGALYDKESCSLTGTLFHQGKSAIIEISAAEVRGLHRLKGQAMNSGTKSMGKDNDLPELFFGFAP